MVTFHETFYTFTINGPLQLQQNPIKYRSLALFVENNETKAFCCAKVFNCCVPFSSKFIQIRQSHFQEVGGVTQHVMFYPRQEIFWRYQVFHHKINLFKVTRHFLCLICNLFHFKWSMHLSIAIIILPYGKIWRVICPSIWLTLLFLILLQSIQAVLDEKPYKDKQLSVVYFQKLYIVPFGFLPYYKCISMCFKTCWHYLLTI